MTLPKAKWKVIGPDLSRYSPRMRRDLLSSARAMHRRMLRELCESIGATIAEPSDQCETTSVGPDDAA